MEGICAESSSGASSNYRANRIFASAASRHHVAFDLSI
jgi:hypothetical protein